MKKILIATSALTALTFSSALALDVKTSGTIEYFITSDSVTAIAERDTSSTADARKEKYLAKTKGNRKLSQKQANVKFSVEGMSSGIAYGSYVKVGSGTNTPNRGKKSVDLNDISATIMHPSNGTTMNLALTATAANAGLAASKSRIHAYTQKGQAVIYGKDSTGSAGNATGSKVWVEKHDNSWKPDTIANNASTRSGLWVSGNFGKVIIGQDSSAAENAFMGDVKAARFFPGTLVSDPRGTHRTLYDAGMERVTYESPGMNGFQISYTKAFSGNVSTAKVAQAVAPQNHAITYKGEMNDVKFKLAYIAGRDKGGMRGLQGSEAPDGHKTVQYKADAPKGTMMGGEIEYGKFTVGYNKFNNKRRFYQTKGTGGNMMGVRYFNKFYAIGYTVINSSDKNTYFGQYASKGNTKAFTGTLWIDKGFKFYASRATNTATYHGLGVPGAKKTAKGKSTYTMLGIQATF